jgi:hypothetical protein
MWPLKRAATAGFVGCAHRTFPFLVGVIFSRHGGRVPFLHGLASCVLARASISEERPRPHSLAPSSASRMSSSQRAARPTSACCSPSKSPRSPTSGPTRCVLGVISLGGCVVARLSPTLSISLPSFLVSYAVASLPAARLPLPSPQLKVGFRTGPNGFSFDYTVACYAQDTVNCGGVLGGTTAPIDSVSGSLPRDYSSVVADMTVRG